MIAETLLIAIWLGLGSVVALSIVVARMHPPQEDNPKPQTGMDMRKQFDVLYEAHNGRSKLEQDDEGNLIRVRSVDVPSLGIALTRRCKV